MTEPAAKTLFRLAPWAVAALLVVAAMMLLRQNAALQQENTALRTERQLAEVAYRMAQNQLKERTLLAETMINSLGRELRRTQDLTRFKVIALAPPPGPAGESRGLVVWDPLQQSGLLTIDRLPVIADSQDYQIWVADPAYPEPVNGGVFRVAADGRVVRAFKPDQPVTQAAAFAISLGQKGGGPQAAGTMVLLGK